MTYKKSINLRLYFILLIFGILSLSIVVSSVLSYILNVRFTPNSSFSILIWFFVFGTILGTCLTSVMSRWILSPVTRLSGAMNQVAAGDFSVRLQAQSRISEIRKTYADFNTMVQELNATEMLQSDFVSNVSHEFKTPINAVEGYAMLLQDKQLPYEEQSEYVERILLNTRRLSALVNNILLLSRVENQTIHADKKQCFRLDEQIRQAILTLEARWTEKNMDFDVEMEQLSYCGSEGLLYNVWVNLIDNAIKFGPYGDTIRICLSSSGEGIRFEIEDNGPGIPEETQKHIFDKFYQADSSHKTEGNGLGLALVRRILDSAGGQISVLCVPNCGCRFTVLLPKNP